MPFISARQFVHEWMKQGDSIGLEESMYDIRSEVMQDFLAMFTVNTGKTTSTTALSNNKTTTTTTTTTTKAKTTTTTT